MAGRDGERLAEEIEAYLATGRAPRPAPEPTARRPRRPPRRRVRTWLRTQWTRPRLRVAVVLVILVAGVVVARRHNAATTDGPDHASPAPAGPGYSFLRTNPSGTPVRWNPCAAVHYRTNLTEAPGNAAADLDGAIAQVTAATGIRFVDDGSTTTIPNRASQAQPARHRAPVVIAWATPAETDLLAKNFTGPLGVHELGVGGATALDDPLTGHSVYVTGLVVIDASASAGLAPGFGPLSLGVVLMHELGHLVGLAHTTNADDIMNPVQHPTKNGTWGPGDLAGLSRLGIGSGCLRVPRRTTTAVYEPRLFNCTVDNAPPRS